MKAVRFDHYGDVDVLYLADVPAPTAEPGRVVVTVRAAGTNPGEASIRKGELESMFPGTFPSGQGTDFAGVVSAVGDGVNSVSVGDEVMGWSHERSSQAEQVSVPAEQVIPKPPELSWEVAGSLAVVGVTAYAAVQAVGAGSGDTVAVSAAAGGVGSLVVQMLRRIGADVIGIASETNFAWLQSVGVTPVAYGDGLADRLREAAPGGIDAFVDCFGGGYCQLALDLGVSPERVDTIIDFEAAQKLGVKAEGAAAIPAADTHRVFTEVAGMVARGEVVVPIAATYPLAQVREAYAELEKRHTHGKIALIP